MTAPIVICGFATRCETLSRAPATYDDELPGIISPGAFSEIIKLNLPIQLIYGGHDSTLPALADSDSGTLLLFDSPLGLCFRAEIYAEEHPELYEIIPEIKDGRVGCSVDFQETKLSATVVNGKQAWRTEAASCTHIALV